MPPKENSTRRVEGRSPLEVSPVMKAEIWTQGRIVLPAITVFDGENFAVYYSWAEGLSVQALEIIRHVYASFCLK
jgi:hypothetical protein